MSAVQDRDDPDEIPKIASTTTISIIVKPPLPIHHSPLPPVSNAHDRHPPTRWSLCQRTRRRHGLHVVLRLPHRHDRRVRLELRRDVDLLRVRNVDGRDSDRDLSYASAAALRSRSRSPGTRGSSRSPPASVSDARRLALGGVMTDGQSRSGRPAPREAKRRAGAPSVDCSLCCVDSSAPVKLLFARITYRIPSRRGAPRDFQSPARPASRRHDAGCASRTRLRAASLPKAFHAEHNRQLRKLGVDGTRVRSTRRGRGSAVISSGARSSSALGLRYRCLMHGRKLDADRAAAEAAGARIAIRTLVARAPRP